MVSKISVLKLHEGKVKSWKPWIKGGSVKTELGKNRAGEKWERKLR